MTTVDTMTADDVRLGDLDFWAQPNAHREAAFAALRRERPVSFHEEPAFQQFPPGRGFWALTTYDNVFDASRHADVFQSGKRIVIPDAPEEIRAIQAQFDSEPSMIEMDDPRHARLRGLVNRGFTPRMVARLEEAVRQSARDIVAKVAPRGECDFVKDIAAALPLKIICDMMGIPEERHERIFELSNQILGGSDPEYDTSDFGMAASLELVGYAYELAEQRRKDPHDDITSVLMAAVEDGERMSATELGSFFLLLVVAGNETTRNAISHGMKALTDHPDQREIWQSDVDGVGPTAVEEIVRWASPVIYMRRTTTREVEVRGVTIPAGDKVVLWYNSANRDETHWENPYRFDVRRTPNDHQGFGAGGPHFCLGAHLARREIRVMFEELFSTLPDIRVSGEPDLLLSPFIHGIKRMPCSWTEVRDRG